MYDFTSTVQLQKGLLTANTYVPLHSDWSTDIPAVSAICRHIGRQSRTELDHCSLPLSVFVCYVDSCSLLTADSSLDDLSTNAVKKSAYQLAHACIDYLMLENRAATDRVFRLPGNMAVVKRYLEIVDNGQVSVCLPSSILSDSCWLRMQAFLWVVYGVVNHSSASPLPPPPSLSLCLSVCLVCTVAFDP